MAVDMATQTMQGMRIDVQRAPSIMDIQMSGYYDGHTRVFHAVEECLFMTDEAKLLGVLGAAQQPWFPAVREMAGAAGEIPFPVERISRRQGATGRKTGGMAELHRVLMATRAQRFLRRNQLRRLLLISIGSGQMAYATIDFCGMGIPAASRSLQRPCRTH
jgi:hypothetical protein